MPDRLPCQVCGRRLVPLKDGTSRYHVASRYGVVLREGCYCEGSGHRLARWPTGQMLRHHAGSVWEVIADAGGTWGDYLLRCVRGSSSERIGHELRVHGEYMHRDGWCPIVPSSCCGICIGPCALRVARGEIDTPTEESADA